MKDQSPSTRIQQRLKLLYSDSIAESLWPRLSSRLEKAKEVFDQSANPLWTEKDAILITYGDSIKEEGMVPLRALDRFVREELGDAIPLVHILPFFPYTSDDGFSISDYEMVREDLGDWSDVSALHEHHDLMFDLVLNHCSASHAWFQQFLKDEEPGRGYFHAPDPSTDLSEVVRPRTHPLLTPFETTAGTKHVWTTFSADQVDLDFSNPDVLVAFLDILLLFVRRGARMIRLDAIAFLWKVPGTSSLHLNETHEVVKLMRDVLEIAAPGVILLTETNVPHEENVSYFGDGDEARMVYQFPLPPLLLHGLRRGKPEALNAWAKALDAPPEGCTFFNFTSSHDGIGMRPLEGLVSHEDVLELADQIRAGGGKVNERSLADGSKKPYELNATYFSALKLPDDDESTHLKRFLLSQTLPMCLQGIPAFYIHCLTATPNDLEGMARTGQNRTINRKMWQRSELDPLLEDPNSPASICLKTITTRLKIRASEEDFHPDVPQEIPDIHEDLFAVKRGKLLALHNFSSSSLDIQVPQGELLLTDDARYLDSGNLRLDPLGVTWIRCS